MFESARRLKRSARVARTAARLYLGYKRTQRRTRSLDAAAADHEWERRHEASAEALYRLAIDLKGLYVKTGQFIGTRSDLLPPAYVRSLSRLHDRVPPRPAPVIRTVVERELGRPIDELFARFEDEPLAAASLAQVHRARLHDGREVVVKVQYPEVAALVRLDVRNLRTITRILARREPNFDYRSVADEIAGQVPLELDFEREAAMTRRVAANLRALPGVVLPEVVDSLVTPKVLVTGYIEGLRLFGPAQPPSSEGAAGIAETLAAAYGHQILVDGLFQADPHPGNILVLPGGKIALLDFGLTKELSLATRLGFARLVLAAASRDVPAIVAAFRELGVRTRSDAPDQVLPLVQLFFDQRDLGRSGLFQRRQGPLAQNPVDAIPGDLVLLGRVVGLLRGVTTSLGAPLTPMQMLRPYAEAALAVAPAPVA